MGLAEASIEADIRIPEKWAPRFFTIWGGQAISLLGSSLVQFALVWYLTKQTGSATVLATATLAAMLPQIILGPFVGVLVDRWNRRLIMIVADGAIALTTFGLVVLFALGKVQIWEIYAAMLIRGLGGAFHYPAMTASTTLMVPKQHLARIGGMNQTLQGVMSIIAPPLGALLISVMPTQNVLMIDVVTAFFGITPLLFFNVPQPVRQAGQASQGQPASSFWRDAREGLHFIVSWPGLMLVGMMATLINFLLTPAASLMPLLVTKHFGLGALAFGLTDTFWGVGMISGGLILSAWGGFRRKIQTILMGIAGIGVGILMIGFAPSAWFGMALAGMFLAGVMVVFCNGPLQALLQAVVPPELQGRVMSLVTSVATALTPLSLIIAGPVSDKVGIQTWYIAAGFSSFLMAIAGFFVPAVLNIEDNHRNAQGQEVPEAQVVPATAD